MLHFGIFFASIPVKEGVHVRGNSVAYQISEDTKLHTTRCNQGFKCLSNESFHTCPVESSVKEGINFVKMVNPMRRCNYCLAFADSHLCRCPTRNELYQRYKK